MLQEDNKEKEKLKAGLTGAILSEKPNVKVRGQLRFALPCMALEQRALLP